MILLQTNTKLHGGMPLFKVSVQFVNMVYIIAFMQFLYAFSEFVSYYSLQMRVDYSSLWIWSQL